MRGVEVVDGGEFFTMKSDSDNFPQMTFHRLCSVQGKVIICGPMVEAGTTAARITREIFLRRLN